MPEITLRSPIFDLTFHPQKPIVYTAQLSGHVRAFSYDERGNLSPLFSVKYSKRSCRGISLSHDGSVLYAVGKEKALNTIDTSLAVVSESRAKVHESTINRVKTLTPWLLVTGDDDGIVKLWDPRQRESTRTYTHHYDCITDFLWLEDKKHLVTTSSDRTLSVVDVRANKTKPVAHSEDQEDELLSIVLIMGGTRAVVGTQLGVLSIFGRSSGWGDCIDRVPGHPQSVDTMCTMPSISGMDTSRMILTGSSDGFVRAVQVLPTKLHGVVADHGDWPVERIAVGTAETSEMNVEKRRTPLPKAGGKQVTKEGDSDDDDDCDGDAQPSCLQTWIGSVGHDVLKLTDLEAFFSPSDKRKEAEDEDDEESIDTNEDKDNNPANDNESASNNPLPQGKRKHKQDKDVMNSENKSFRAALWPMNRT
ncbi:WD40 repeat-like protein [Fistulina hepatica ATCC 64428]|uniref:WD repeat-containing protein JIP5 n=1 Tax=Fistulina hepatica ATCC 64428 TaxID=1128425 RepID=A0A0D7AHL7_9AGAR|nr:WD40 repeat-like protein [Fistulina hepatica ATCC 64428]